MARLTVLDGDPGTGDVGLVLAGGGARGAYSAGALSVLLPQLADQVGVVVGSSVGAVTAAYLAANWERVCDPSFNAGCQLWRELGFRDVIAPLTSFGGMRRAVGHLSTLLPIATLRQPSVFDTSPLARTMRELISFERLNENLNRERLTMGLMATSAHDQSPLVFCKGATAQFAGDMSRGIEYVSSERLALEHVLASAAIPALFPAVHVGQPERVAGWYYDGAPTLNTPIRPALRLGAKRMIVIALNSITPRRATNDQRRPDVFTGAFQFLHCAFADPLGQDIHALAHANGDADARVDERQPVPYIFIAPENPAAIGQVATRVWREHYSRPARSGARRDLWLLGQLLDAGADEHRGELLSYLFFAPEFADALIELGRRDARRWLDTHNPNPWRLGLLPTSSHADHTARNASTAAMPAPRPRDMVAMRPRAQ